MHEDRSRRATWRKSKELEPAQRNAIIEAGNGIKLQSLDSKFASSWEEVEGERG